MADYPMMNLVTDVYSRHSEGLVMLLSTIGTTLPQDSVVIKEEADRTQVHIIKKMLVTKMVILKMLTHNGMFLMMVTHGKITHGMTTMITHGIRTSGTQDNQALMVGT